jgi:tRNA A37 N6-isopentenylltransferase MiaA
LPRAGEQILIVTRQYAKRQRTWLRHQIGQVTRVDPLASTWQDTVLRWWSDVTAGEARRV